MTTEKRLWHFVVKPVEESPVKLLVRARYLGVAVYYEDIDCKEFDSAAGAFGVFRAFGGVRFNKRTRRWSAFPRADVTAAEHATTIFYACQQAEKHGTSPGHGLRSKEWEHRKTRGGDPIAFARLSRRLGLNEAPAAAATGTIVPATADDLLRLCSTGFEPSRHEVDA